MLNTFIEKYKSWTDAQRKAADQQLKRAIIQNESGVTSGYLSRDEFVDIVWDKPELTPAYTSLIPFYRDDNMDMDFDLIYSAVKLKSLDVVDIYIECFRRGYVNIDDAVKWVINNCITDTLFASDDDDTTVFVLRVLERLVTKLPIKMSVKSFGADFPEDLRLSLEKFDIPRCLEIRNQEIHTSISDGYRFIFVPDNRYIDPDK